MWRPPRGLSPPQSRARYNPCGRFILITHLASRIIPRPQQSPSPSVISRLTVSLQSSYSQSYSRTSRVLVLCLGGPRDAASHITRQQTAKRPHPPPSQRPVFSAASCDMMRRETPWRRPGADKTHARGLAMHEPMHTHTHAQETARRCGRRSSYDERESTTWHSCIRPWRADDSGSRQQASTAA